MKRMSSCWSFAQAIGLSACVLLAPSVWSQRDVVGAEDDEDEDGNKKPKVEEKKADKKAEDKKTEDKKDDKKAKDKKADEKKADGKKADEKKKKEGPASPDDVLGETAADKKKRDSEDSARKAAERAADEEAKKKSEADAALKEKKRDASEKRLKDSRESRLASAKRTRPLQRDTGVVSASIAIEPGAVTKGVLTEIRIDLGKKLDVADARYGDREPMRGLELTAVVTEPTGKKDARRVYAVHPLGAPGQYGFHMTPTKDQALQVQIVGTTADGAPVDAAFTLHVGAWPPPDFDDEERKLSKDK
jgi:hypothetical protein